MNFFVHKVNTLEPSSFFDSHASTVNEREGKTQNVTMMTRGQRSFQWNRILSQKLLFFISTTFSVRILLAVASKDSRRSSQAAKLCTKALVYLMHVRLQHHRHQQM
jgi:hypothetical protein